MDKSIKWKRDIEAIIATKSPSYKDIDTLIGFLNYDDHIIPALWHFLGCLWPALKCHQKSSAPRTQVVLYDLYLWLNFTDQATTGILINSLVFCMVDITLWSDASKYGMGGFVSKGTAWRYELLSCFQGMLTLNTIESIASVITLEQALCNAIPSTCFLRLSGTSSVVGWMHKSKLNEATHTDHLHIAYRAAHTIITSKAVGYSQHISGKINLIADHLS
eukprot:15334797-Ditylum_brightwellii.AAC.2